MEERREFENPYEDYEALKDKERNTVINIHLENKVGKLICPFQLLCVTKENYYISSHIISATSIINIIVI